jgi:hypothetical protein
MNNVEVKQGLEQAFAELETLWDEIRVNLHLAGMDLRDEWSALEQRLPDRRSAQRVKAATNGAVEALTEEVRAFRRRLHEGRAG